MMVWEHQGGGWASLRSTLGNRTAGGGPREQGEEGRAGGKRVSPGNGLSPQAEKELVCALRSCQVKWLGCRLALELNDYGNS